MFVFSSGPICRPLRFADDGKFPNSDLPVLWYKQIFTPRATLVDLSALRQVLDPVIHQHRWRLQWVEADAVYTYTHYHSTAHEILTVLQGGADIFLGGAEGQQIRVKSGDALAIPAGVAHRRTRVHHGSDFVVAGLYPNGQLPDLRKNFAGDYMEAQLNIPNVTLPIADPFYGPSGPLMQYWK